MRLTPIAARPIAPPSPAALPEPSVPPSPAAGQGAQTDLTQLPLPLSIASQIPARARKPERLPGQQGQQEQAAAKSDHDAPYPYDWHDSPSCDDGDDDWRRDGASSRRVRRHDGSGCETLTSPRLLPGNGKPSNNAPLAPRRAAARQRAARQAAVQQAAARQAAAHRRACPAAALATLPARKAAVPGQPAACSISTPMAAGVLICPRPAPSIHPWSSLRPRSGSALAPWAAASRSRRRLTPMARPAMTRALRGRAARRVMARTHCRPCPRCCRKSTFRQPQRR